MTPQDLPHSGEAKSLSIKPREARVIASRILRQADWDWGLEPAVASVVLAAHRQGLDGLAVLEKDWEAIRRSHPERIAANDVGPHAWRFDCAGCHAFVAAPSLLDHLGQGVHRAGTASVTVANCLRPELLAVLRPFGKDYGLAIEFAAGSDATPAIAASRQPPGVAAANSRLPGGSYAVPSDLWPRLQRMALGYLVPESEISRGHAGDGTRDLPLTGSPASGPADSRRVLSQD